jgi:ADP-ribosylglycohydrolase
MKNLGDRATNDSKGCGGVMRAAPVGLFAWSLARAESHDETFALSEELAALTHGHPTGSLTAGVLAVVIQVLVDGGSLPEALAAAKRILAKESHHEETLHAIEQAEELAGSDVPHHVAIAQLGEGWIAEEALAVAVYCALVARSFEHGVVIAANHDGDTDSTAAIAGNLLGAQLGVAAIPLAWLDRLELREVISEIARDLHDLRSWDIGESSGDREATERIWKKYPGF